MGQSATGKKDAINTVENEYREKLQNNRHLNFEQFFTNNQAV